MSLLRSAAAAVMAACAAAAPAYAAGNAISYDLNGVAGVVHRDEGDSHVPDMELDFDGFEFTGRWNTERDGSGRSYSAGDEVHGPVTLYAQWRDGTMLCPGVDRTVRFVGPAGVIDTQRVPDGASASAPEDPSSAGRDFAGWDTDFTGVSSDLTVTALWNPPAGPRSTVTFQQRGDDGTRLLDTRVVSRGAAVGAAPDDAVSLPGGYRLAGWTSYQTGHPDRIYSSEAVAAYRAAGDMTWSAAVVERGSAADADAVAAGGSLLQEGNNGTVRLYDGDDLLASFVPSGGVIGGEAMRRIVSTMEYVPAGWTSEDAPEPDRLYTTSEVASLPMAYAMRWSAVTQYEGTDAVSHSSQARGSRKGAGGATASFYVDGEYVGDMTGDVGGCVGASPASLVSLKPGLTLLGWTSGQSGDGRTYASKEVALYTLAGDMRWDAVTARAEDAHTVTFTDGAGHAVSSQRVGRDGAKAPVDPRRPGYVFTGWDRDYTVVRCDIVVNATWRASTGDHSVSFSDGMGVISTRRIADGSEIGEVPEARTGSSGWTAPGLGRVCSDAEVAGMRPASDIAFSAVPAPAMRTVTFTDGLGNKVSEVSVTDGGRAEPPAPPARLGYAFGGWDADTGHVTSDMTVSATWVPDPSSLSAFPSALPSAG